jgi:vitamin B12 transporter
MKRFAATFRTRSFCSLGLFLVLALSPALYSGDKKEKPDIEEKVEVIGKVPFNRAMQSVSLLDRERIRELAPDGLKGILNQSPGLLVLNAGNPAQFSYSFARGAAVNQMLYLVDGVKLHDPSSSLAGNFSFLAPPLIEKVEVVRGPLSNLYGSSAMGGVVNIVTRRREGLGFSLSGGSCGTLEGDVHFGKRLGDLSLFVSGELLDFDERQLNDRFARRGFSIHSEYRKDRLSFGASFFGSLLEAGIPWNLGQATPERRYGQDNLLVAFPLSLRLAGSGILEITGSLHWNRYDFSDPGDPWNSAYGNHSFLAELQARYATRLRPDLNLVAGVDLSRQRIGNDNNGEVLLAAAAVNVAALYADLQADLGRLLLAASLRFDKHGDRRGVFSPQAGVSFNALPFLKLRASYSGSFRAPALPEMLNPYWGNAGLLPETGRSLEAGADLFFPALSCGFSVFASHYENLIGFSPLTSRFANISAARISGVEASCDWSISRSTGWRAAYTFLHTQDLQYGRELLRRPRHVLATSLHYRRRGFAAAAEVTYVGRRLDYDELLWAVAESKAFDHLALNAAIPLGERIVFSCRVTNALNARFEEVMGYPAPLRRVMLGIAYRSGD